MIIKAAAEAVVVVVVVVVVIVVVVRIGSNTQSRIYKTSICIQAPLGEFGLHNVIKP